MTPRAFRLALDLLLSQFYSRTRRDVQQALNSGFDDATLREVLVRLLLPRIREMRRDAWALGEEFIQDQALASGAGYVDVAPLRGYAERAVERLVDDHMQRWRDADPTEEFFDRRADRLLSSAMRHVQQGVRDQVADTMRDAEEEESLDRAAGRWARMLTGADNCGFCIMLASRGPVYSVEEAAWFSAAGDTYHDNCDCVVVPVFNPASWDGREQATALYRLWRDATRGVSGGYSRRNGGVTARPAALTALDAYLTQERADGRDPIAEIVGDLRADPMARNA